VKRLKPIKALNVGKLALSWNMITSVGYGKRPVEYFLYDWNESGRHIGVVQRWSVGRFWEGMFTPDGYVGSFGDRRTFSTLREAKAYVETMYRGWQAERMLREER
jgi:hypothetical protein